MLSATLVLVFLLTIVVIWLLVKVSDLATAVTATNPATMLQAVLNGLQENPRVQNLIHLDLKGTNLKAVQKDKNLDIDPKVFKPEPDKLFQKLFDLYEGGRETYKSNTNTWAYSILDHSGFDQLVTYDSVGDIKKALIRLLINDNKDEVSKFLRTLADSV